MLPVVYLVVILLRMISTVGSCAMKKAVATSTPFQLVGFRCVLQPLNVPSLHRHRYSRQRLSGVHAVGVCFRPLLAGRRRLRRIAWRRVETRPHVPVSSQRYHAVVAAHVALTGAPCRSIDWCAHHFGWQSTLCATATTHTAAGQCVSAGGTHGVGSGRLETASECTGSRFSWIERLQSLEYLVRVNVDVTDWRVRGAVDADLSGVLLRPRRVVVSSVQSESELRANVSSLPAPPGATVLGRPTIRPLLQFDVFL